MRCRTCRRWVTSAHPATRPIPRAPPLRCQKGDILYDNAARYYRMEDVPYVQYFTKGFGLHGAFWHRSFGHVRSHGCVNLAPLDAAWLFGWTTPEVPDEWHSAMSLKQGTIVYIHP